MTNERALQDSLRIKFTDDLYDIIFQRCLKLVPVVTGQRYLPTTNELITVVSNAYWANTYVPPVVAPQALLYEGRPSIWLN